MTFDKAIYLIAGIVFAIAGFVYKDAYPMVIAALFMYLVFQEGANEQFHKRIKELEDERRVD